MFVGNRKKKMFMLSAIEFSSLHGIHTPRPILPTIAYRPHYPYMTLDVVTYQAGNGTNTNMR